MGSLLAFPCASDYAESILRAWVAGDWQKLEVELDRGMKVRHIRNNGWEEEREELVSAIASQLKMLIHGDPVEVDEVRTRLFVHLLRSLMDPGGSLAPRM